MALVLSGVVVEPLVEADRTAPAGRVDVRIADGRVERIAPRIVPATGDEVIEADGASVIPGLHDHHVHLLAWAAELSSVSVDPARVLDAAALGGVLRAAPGGPGTWVRATGYHESIAGVLDRDALDALVGDRPIRIQHRSGALWMLNTRALELLQIEADGRSDGSRQHGPSLGPLPDGLERENGGRPTGRLWRADRWLHERRIALAPEPPPDLGPIGRRAAAAGVTGFTDATPDLDAEGLDVLLDAHARGVLPQRLHLMGDAARTGARIERPRAGFDQTEVTVGPRKRLLDDDRLPPLETLVEWVTDAHRRRVPVALHCVTRTQAALAVAAWHEAGTRPGDRMEHGAVLGQDLVAALATLGVTVVTQPGFLRSRGDRYLADVETDDHPDLWRLRSLLDAGVEVGLSSDAPLGSDDPWTNIRAAALRSTLAGSVITPGESVPPRLALSLFCGEARRPGRVRTIEPGSPADLVVLRGRIDEALDAGPAGVRATIVGGRVVYGLDGDQSAG
jgi:predicted amidohydrolase YtcJ